MKLRAKNTLNTTPPAEHAGKFVWNTSQWFITEGKEYTPIAIIFTDCMSLAYIIDDIGEASALPIVAFEIVSAQVSPSWTIGVFSSNRVVFGPEFMTRSLDAYDMVVNEALYDTSRLVDYLQSLR